MRASWLSTCELIEPLALRTAGVRALTLDSARPAPMLDFVALDGGYCRQDVAVLGATTPELDVLLTRFAEEHRHAEDEVRYVQDGTGVFDVRGPDDAWMRIEVRAGDLIVIPAFRWHRFFLGMARSIRCIRMFRDPAGWIAEPREHHASVA